MSRFYAVLILVCVGFAAAGREKLGAHGLLESRSDPSPGEKSGGDGLTLDERRQACKNVCSRHGSMTSEERECQTRCRVKTDLGSEDAKRLNDFARESPKRLRRLEDTTGREVEPCSPMADVHTVHFADLDLNHDQHVSLQEVTAFTDLLCIDRDTAGRMFSSGDVNHDGIITEKEWNSSGEDTVFEYQVDKFADKHVEPQPEAPEDIARNALAELIGEVKAPPFETLDKNGDGRLDDWEMVGAFMTEIMNRDPQMSLKARRIIQNKLYDQMPGIFETLDKNHDHQLSPEEYEVKKKKQNFGNEILEAAHASTEKAEQER